MKNVFYVRHGDTYFTERGLIQGGADGEQNKLSEKGKKRIETQTLPEVLRIAREKQPCEIFVYTGTQNRIVETAEIFGPALVAEGLLSADNTHVIQDERLNGRHYGSLEGMNEKALRNPKNLILKPAKTWSYLFAEAGLGNLARVEKKTAYQDKVFDFVTELMFNHDGKENHVVFLVGGSDFFRTMQKSKDVAQLCYFGDEELEIQHNSNGMQSKMKIDYGEVKSIIIEKPDFIYSRNAFRSTAEKYATSKFIHSGMGKIQKGD